MKLVDFVEQYNGAPLDIEEFADGASSIGDCPTLRDAADEYIVARRHFENALDKYSVVIG